MVADLRSFSQRLCLLDNALRKSVVCLKRFHATPGFGIGVDDVGDVRVFFDGQVDKSQPVVGGYQVEGVVSDVAHQQKLAGEELAVHLVGLNGKKCAETADGFSVEAIAGIGPGEWMGEELIPCLNEGADGFTKVLNRAEGIILED